MASYPALDLRFAPGPGAGTLQDMLYAELDSFEPVAIQEQESGDGWRVFFRTRTQRDGARRALAAEFENALELHAIDVDDEDWARRSQEALKAARAGRIVVAPPWDVPRNRDSRVAARDSNREPPNRELPNPEPPNREPPNREPPNRELPNPEPPNREPRTANRDLVIVIDPSTGFGTGHHATTRLCLELLQEIDLTGKRVIDIGTGSGVLAIAAAKLGAAEVIAIDNDPDALQNARENVRRNSVEIQVREADLSAPGVAAADVVVANLTSAVLQRFAEPVQSLLVPEGTLIVSGFSPDDLDDITAALGAVPQKVATDGEWAAASLLLSRLASR